MEPQASTVVEHSLPYHHHLHPHHHHHHHRQAVVEELRTVQQGQLEPFHHQVAGQSLVFRYDAETICKSLIPRELEIYRTLPDILRPHVPQFKGVVAIPLSRTTDNRGEEEEEGEDKEREGATHPLTTQRLLDKVAKSHAEDNVYHFLLLENIVGGYQRPCVLDLKLGTRQHGDDAPPDKVRYQLDKCRASTSANLGVRLCGMKVYQPKTGSHTQIDKAEGRRMREKDFRDAMRRFLFDGCDVRRDLIPSILGRLRSLKAAIAQLPTYRFYSCSLLITYDGVEEDFGRRNLSPSQDQATNAEFTPDHIPGRSYNRDKSGLEQCGPKSSLTLPDGTEAGRETAQSSSTKRQPSDSTKQEAYCESNVTSCLEKDINGVVGQQLYDDELSSSSLPDSPNQNSHGSRDVEDRSISDHNRHGRSAVDWSPSVASEGDGPANVCVHKNCDRASPTDQRDRVSLNEDTARPESVTTRSSSPPFSDSFAVKSSCCDCSGVMAAKVDARLVDFAHTTHSEFVGDAVVHSGPDRGCLLGLQTLVEVFTHIYNDSVPRG